MKRTMIYYVTYRNDSQVYVYSIVPPRLPIHRDIVHVHCEWQ